MSISLHTGDFEGRRAPYAPISALERFFVLIRDRAVPERVDHRFLQKLNVASNNEYSLLSALKFLGVLDDRGAPTHSYRLLQTTDRFQETLRHLVETAYRPVFEAGAERMSDADLVNFFRVSSSASQARNAARFFRAVCELAGGLSAERTRVLEEAEEQEPSETRHVMPPTEPRHDHIPSGSPDLLLAAKAQLLAKMPAATPDWPAADYRAVCESFVAMLRSLDNHKQS